MTLVSWIAGEPCAANQDLVEVIHPGDGQPHTHFAQATHDDVDRAVKAARKAYTERWRFDAPSARKAVLLRFADLIAADAPELDRLDAGDMGKPISLAVSNASAAAGLLRFFAEAIDKLSGDVFASDNHALTLQRRVPRGVVAAITPWNFPTMNAMRKLAPALAGGNAVVLKPSELAPRSALHLAKLADAAGLPSGVLNVVLGRGAAVGSALALHDDVDMVTFTGSTAVGKQMMQYSGQSNLKVVMAECGGKSPQIVFADGVNLDEAAQAVAGSLLTNQGQVCTVGSRLIVERSISADFIARVAALVGAARIGDPLDPVTSFGPLVSARQAERVLDFIEEAKRSDAQLVTGGDRALVDSGGSYVTPTIFQRVDPSARLAQDEIFGPVLAVMTFADEAEAIRIANNTSYSLAAYAWTADLGRAMRLAKSISSSIRINADGVASEGAGHAYGSEPGGASGIGVESGLAGMESYMRRQGVWINHR